MYYTIGKRQKWFIKPHRQALQGLRESVAVLVIASIVALGLAATPADAATAPTYGLAAITNMDNLASLQTGTTFGGNSSYDRSGGNVDYNNFLPPVNGEKVMLNQTGPGTVYRIWATGFNPTTNWIKVYFDGSNTPRINMTMGNFFSGNTSPFLSPLAASNLQSSGGYTSYLPLPYSRSIRITTNMSNYYNIDYKTYPAGTKITTWTGSENSTAARNLWNNIGTDPKSTTGNVTASGTTTIAAGASQTILDSTGPRSISSIKVKIPGVAPQASVTDDGRAFKGSSQFTMAVNPSNTGVTLKRRMDFGIGNQRAGVYVNGAYVGDWIDGGLNEAFRWNDSSFAIPASFTAGKSSLAIKVQFVSSDNDWNEFTYWTYSTVNGSPVLSDTLNVGDTSSESQHGYSVTNATWNGTRTFLYAPAANTVDPLNNLRLRITWDNQAAPAVDAPLGAIYGVGHYGALNTKTLIAGMNPDGQMYLYLPMPFASHAIVQLYNGGTGTVSGVQYEVQHKPYSGDLSQTGYLHTQYNVVTPAIVGADLPFVDVSGQGVLVGATASYQSQNGGQFPGNYLEGDEHIYIDGASSPAINGTGTEDFYDGGYYFSQGPFNRPASSAAANGWNGSNYITSASRFYMSDSVPFTTHLKLSMEHGPVNDTANNAWTLGYYYLKP